MTQEEIWRKYITDVHTKFKRKGLEGDRLKKYTIDLVTEYKNTKNSKIGEMLFDCTVAYVFHLWGKRKSTFCGYDLYDNMGSVYEEVTRTAELYEINSNVPFHLYFGRRLWAKFSHMRDRENYFNVPSDKCKKQKKQLKSGESTIPDEDTCKKQKKQKKQLKSSVESKIPHDDMMRILTEFESDFYNESW